MPLQDPPAPLDRVVLAVVRRQVHPFHRHPVPVHERDHPLQELRPGTGDLGPVTQLDVQAGDAGVDRLPLAPPEVEAIGQEVARLSGVAEPEPRLVDRDRPAAHLQHPERHQEGLRGHVVIEGLHRRGTPGRAPAGEVAEMR